MKILFVTSECYPFLKTGGLADVAYALPKEMNNLGEDTRVIMPNYGSIPEKFQDKMEHLFDTSVKVASRVISPDVVTNTGAVDVPLINKSCWSAGKSSAPTRLD